MAACALYTTTFFHISFAYTINRLRAFCALRRGTLFCMHARSAHAAPRRFSFFVSVGWWQMPCACIPFTAFPVMPAHCAPLHSACPAARATSCWRWICRCAWRRGALWAASLAQRETRRYPNCARDARRPLSHLKHCENMPFCNARLSKTRQCAAALRAGFQALGG